MQTGLATSLAINACESELEISTNLSASVKFGASLKLTAQSSRVLHHIEHTIVPQLRLDDRSVSWLLGEDRSVIQLLFTQLEVHTIRNL